MANRITHFEIQADDVERAKKFYGGVFDWEFVDYSSYTGSLYWGIMTTEKESKEPGINGGLLQRPIKAPGVGQGTNAYVCTIQVENFDEIAKKIMSAGGIVAMSKYAMAGMAWQGYFQDTEGNTFGLHQTDPNAK